MDSLQQTTAAVFTDAERGVLTAVGNILSETGRNVPQSETGTGVDALLDAESAEFAAGYLAGAMLMSVQPGRVMRAIFQNG